MAYHREIHLVRSYPCPQTTLWSFWATREGLASFFGADQSVEFRPGGRFEIYFLMDKPEGLRGSESCTILRHEPPERLAFTWNAPPHLPHCREQYTVVEVRLEAKGKAATELTLVHQGFGTGEEWDACMGYFEKAWPMVLDNLREAIARKGHAESNEYTG